VSHNPPLWGNGGGGYPGLDGYDYDVFAGQQLQPHRAQSVYSGDFFAEYYPAFEPYENPFISTPPFYEPGMTSGQQQGWIDRLLARGVQAAESYIRAYVGKVTDKLFDKFLIEVYPYSLAQAQKSGLAQEGFWFGDIMRVNPDGKWGMIYQNIGDLNAAKRYWDNKARSDHFQVGFCPRGSEDLPLGTCEWVTYGSPLQRLYKAGIGGGLLWLALAGAAVYFTPRLLRGLR
jgi:hypothetical protein